jgi:hypothetical protein
MNLFDQFEATLSESPATLSLANAAEGKPIQTPEQRETEWLKQRWGLFTASEVHKLMTYEGKDELPKGAITYVRKKAAETLTEFHAEPIVTPAMQWGLDKEPEAVELFQAKTGLHVTHCKESQAFIDGGHFGGTPDGLIPAELSGLEIKCPNSDTHLDYLTVKSAFDLKEMAPQYYWQIHCLMLLQKCYHWYFVSYDPRFLREDLRLHIVRIDADHADLARLRRRLEQANALKTNILSSFRTEKIPQPEEPYNPPPLAPQWDSFGAW